MCLAHAGNLHFHDFDDVDDLDPVSIVWVGWARWGGEGYHSRGFVEGEALEGGGW